jgi:hypothetical protein
MRRLALLLAFTACKTGSTAGPTGSDEITYHGASAHADDDVYKPSYDKSDVHQALTAERGAEASGELRLRELEDKGDYEQLRTASADLAVRRRFIASLEACEATGQVCPPRLDNPSWTYAIDSDADPKLDSHLRFDLASWQKISAELHGRACACRTVACVDSMFSAIDRLETRPMPDVQGDEPASLSITRARECLYRLRGLRPMPKVAAE